MVPTEVLAKQHFEELSNTFLPYGIKVECLVGSTSLKEKRRIYENIRHGLTDIVIGTHALIEDKVEYSNLGLVVTDEQHRFGVEQRRKLANKGTFPHVLVMSATPIPRTLAIIMYADLDISVISQLPKEENQLKTVLWVRATDRQRTNSLPRRLQKEDRLMLYVPWFQKAMHLTLQM